MAGLEPAACLMLLAFFCIASLPVVVDVVSCLLSLVCSHYATLFQRGHISLGAVHSELVCFSVESALAARSFAGGSCEFSDLQPRLNKFDCSTLF